MLCLIGILERNNKYRTYYIIMVEILPELKNNKPKVEEIQGLIQAK